MVGFYSISVNMNVCDGGSIRNHECIKDNVSL